ncbi:MAG: DUF3808 domain-containing protein [Ignavibacteriales bacterium]|nr:DUF3808 domain-containing protein [Ignavibacteriales bacterium]
MRKTALITILALACTLPALSQTDWAKVHELTIKGIDQLYNLDLEQSEKTFEEVIRTAPADPRGHFFKSMIHYWVYNLTKDETAYKKFFELSEAVIEVCEKELDRDENNGAAKYYLGGMYGFRGLAYQRNGSILSAAWDGRKGYSYLKEATKDSPEVYDAQMGFGLFNYLVAKVPRAFRWILSLLGFSGDAEGGIESLRIAAEKGTYARNEATFFLAQILFWEDREDEARKYLKRLIDKYPENSLFLVTYAQWELRKDNVESAMVIAQKAVAINARREIQFGDEFAYSVLANCHFAKNDFEQAKNNIEVSLEKTENKQSIFNGTYYRLGLCYDIIGQREKALSTYRLTKKADISSNPWEYHSYRLAQKRIKVPPNEVDIWLTKASNHETLKKHAEALTLLEHVLADHRTDTDQRAAALYAILQIRYDKNEFSEVIYTAQQLSMLRPPNELWLVPHGLLRMGQAYAKLGKPTEARRAFEAIDDYDDYDFQGRLESRVEDELKKLKGVN